MSQVTETTPVEPVVQAKSSRGCLYGCLALFVIMIAMVACGGFGAYYVFTNQVEKFTSDKPSELPVVEFSPEKMSELQTRLDTFKAAIDEAQPTDDLVLTAEEINAFINQDEKMRGRVFVKIENGQVTGDLSLPTDAIPGGDGRFFNASGTFDVQLENGVLVVTLADAEVKGEKVPAEILEGLSHENLAKDLYKDPEQAKMIRRFESVRIEDDKIIFQLRRDAAGDSVENPENNADAQQSDAPTGEETTGDAPQAAPAESPSAVTPPAVVSPQSAAPDATAPVEVSE